MNSLPVLRNLPLAAVLVRWSLALSALGFVHASPAAGRCEDPVRFDVPALIAVGEFPSVDGTLQDERTIGIVLPVSCWITPDERQTFQEFRFDIHWNRSVYPLADYSPRTLMQSPVDGIVAVEKRTERNLKVGVDAGSPSLDFQPAAHLEGGLLNSETTRFGEIPRHEMLVASGTIQRGTGAFFRYHPSRQFALEGGREVCLVYRVPLSWRGGILRVVCEASGHRKSFAGRKDPVTVSTAFVVPVYWKDDAVARDTAVDYVRSEQQLRGAWSEYLRQRENSRPRTVLAHFQQLGQGSGPDPLPDSWASDLIQSPLDGMLERDAELLSAPLRQAAGEFIAVRRRMIELSLPGPPSPENRGAQSAWQTRSPTAVVE